MVKEALVWALALTVLAGCSSQRVYQGVYEGARVRSQLQSTPADRVGKPELPVDYQRYDALRRKESD